MTAVQLAARPWRHDLAGCLHASTATLLLHHGLDPETMLGADWSFGYRSGDVRSEEYYFPGEPEQSLLAAVVPHSGLASQWHAPADATTAWAQVRQELVEGHLVAVAVDNFHLPFRPAFHDVHANHLILITGFDDESGTVEVLDQVPPAFAGRLSLADLSRARDSGNPAHHDRDLFFTNDPIANRWFSVRQVAEPRPWTWPSVRSVITENVTRYQEPLGDGHFRGLAGIEHFLADCAARITAGEDVADELFVVAGTALAATAVHADWLRTAATAFGRIELAEAAREVDLVAHHWPAIRILAALSRNAPATGERIAHRAGRLSRAYAQALATLSLVPQE